MINFWLARAATIVEREVILVKNTSDTKAWYDKMPNTLPIIYPSKKQPTNPSEFGPKVGMVHHLRHTRFGIEGVFKAPRKYHRMQYYVLHDKINYPSSPFWVIIYNESNK